MHPNREFVSVPPSRVGHWLLVGFLALAALFVGGIVSLIWALRTDTPLNMAISSDLAHRQKRSR